MKTTKTIFVVPAYNSSSRLGGERFASNLNEIAKELTRQAQHNRVLVVDNSNAKDNGQTRQTALASKCLVISVPPISAGYARFCGVEHAFRELQADVAIIGDDDLHVLPKGIPPFVAGIKGGADLVVGTRVLKDRLSHPLWQYSLEEMVNLYATCRLGMAPTDSLSLDFLSGGQAFGREGWTEFRARVSEEKMKTLGHAATFFPGVYHALGLTVTSIDISGPYEGDYWRDSLSLNALAKRVKTIYRDIQDIEAARKYFRCWD